MRETQNVQTLYAFSEKVLSRPRDWPECAHITGYWPLDPPASWTPPAELSAFLDSGPRPVFVGFGSMVCRDPQERTAELVAALQRCGLRGVIHVGGGGAFARVPATKDICFIENAPFSWLFPRMAAVVHHGGAGTTLTAIRAGVPSIIAPVAFDQYSWADVVVALGVGLKTTRCDTLKVAELEAKLAQLLKDSAFTETTRKLRDAMAGEDGLDNAARLIEKIGHGVAITHSHRRLLANGG